MPKGIIQVIKDGTGGRYGFIKRAGGADIHFAFANVSGFTPKEGTEVEFEIARGSNGGETAVKVRLAGSRVEHTRGATITEAPAQGEARFLNPYNFVRFLGKVDRQGPPSHDRYEGLSGIIECAIIVKTPLFISKGEPDKREDEHPLYSFYSIGGKPVVPSSSLRGMLRSVYEAATNSCYLVFDNVRWYRRMLSREGQGLIPAKIIKSSEGHSLRLFKGKRAAGDFPHLQAAAWVRRYDPLNGRPVQRSKVDLQGFSHNQECYAVMQPQRHQTKPIS